MIGLTLSRKRLHAQLCANLKIHYIGIGYPYPDLNFRLRFLKFWSGLEMPRLLGSRLRFSVMKNWTFSPIFPLLLHQFSSVFNTSKIFQDLGSFD